MASGNGACFLVLEAKPVGVELEGLFGGDGARGDLGQPPEGVFHCPGGVRGASEISPLIGVGLVIVELPLGGGVLNQAVAGGAHREMAIFLDRDGGASALLGGIHEPGDETDAVQTSHRREIAKLDQGGKDVDEADGLCTPLICFARVGGDDDERNAGRFFPEGAFVPVPFLAEMPTVIGPEHDDGILGGRAPGERIEDAADLGVSKGDAGEVMLHCGPPLAGFTKAGEIAGFAERKLAPRRGDICEIIRVRFGKDHLFEGIEVEVFPGDVPGHVGMEDPGGQEKGRPLVRDCLVLVGRRSFRPQVIEISDGVVCHGGVVVVGFLEGEHAPIGFAGVEFDPGVGKLLWLSLLFGPRVECGAMTEPTVVIEMIALEVVPLIGGIVAGRVMVDLARAGGVVTMLPEMKRNGAQVREIWLPPLLVVVEAGGGGEETAQDGGPAGAAYCRGTVGVGKGGAAGGESIEIRGMHLAWAPAQKTDPVVEIIDGQEEDVGTDRSGEER